MSGLERVLNWFESGALVRPAAGGLNFTDLTRALLHLAGADGVESGAGVEEISRLIGPADHYVFILADGLGSRFLDRLPSASFLRSNKTADIQAVFPPTTASALTTLATGQWPAAHGVPGWWMYLEEFDLTATTLLFAERFSGRRLEDFGVSAREVFPVPSVWPRLKHAPLTVIGGGIAESTFTRYAVGETPRAGFSKDAEAFTAVERRIAEACSRTFTYAYLPQIDTLSHEWGVDDERVDRALAVLDENMERLAGCLAGKARIVIAADHGLVNTPEDHRFIVEEGDPLFEHLVCPPTGGPKMPIFHVKAGREGEFAAAFAARFGEYFALITADEAEELRLFGPEPLSLVMKRRLGAFFGISGRPSTICRKPAAGEAIVLAAAHTGLTPEEMVVPLILA